MSASNWEEVYQVQTARIADLERENAELKATLAAVFEANERGRKAWQEAHLDKQMVWPDQAKLVEWLLRENAELRAHAERVGDANDQMVIENAALREDKERLDYIFWPSRSTKTRRRMIQLFGTPEYQGEDAGLRAWRDSIDYYRKEAQQ